MNRQLTFALDTERCSGCFACVVACQDQNDAFLAKPSFRQVGHLENGTYPTHLSFVSIACFHCGDAPCLMACPTGAIFRRSETAIVDIDRDLCIGCHSCELACPFGAPKFADDGKMAKCNLCSVRVEHGMEPACVHTCPTRALTFDDTVSLAKTKADRASLRILRALTPQAVRE
jgi:anaerobic dimethyl sulfoxide reductase subunit B (iron-sulfur subunit)